MTLLMAVTKSADDTRDLAGALASIVEPSDVILLTGDLGAGKTTFTQGFGRGLDVVDRITSPTFTLVQHYRGRLAIVHVDVYRLEHLQEVIDLGLHEMIDEGAVALIEWGEAAAPALAPDYLSVRFGFGTADDDRTLSIDATGARWGQRSVSLLAVLDRWSAAA